MTSISTILYLPSLRHLGPTSSHLYPLKLFAKIKPFKTMPSGNTDTAAVSEALAAHGYTVLPNGTIVKKENNSK